MIVVITKVIVLSLSVTVSCKSLRSEPMCSGYDYEEKLLTKTIKLEEAVEKLVRNNNEIESKFTETLENHAGKFEKLEKDLMRMDDKMNASEDGKRVQQKGCPSSYMHDKAVKLCWRLQKHVKLNWFDASKECSNEGSHLMILNTTTSVKIIQNYLAAADASWVFVGAHDMIEEGVFKWLNGESVQQIPWHSGQPGGGENQNCLSIEKGLNYNFNDQQCSEKFQLLCQITL